MFCSKGNVKICFSGTFSAVYECVCRQSNEKYAVKIVDVPRFLAVHSRDQLANETKIAHILQQPNTAHATRNTSTG